MKSECWSDTFSWLISHDMLSEIQNQDYVQLQSSKMAQSLICALNWRYPHKEFQANHINMSWKIEQKLKKKKIKFKHFNCFNFQNLKIDIWLVIVREL